MHIITIGSDKTLLDVRSAAAKRAIEYGSLVKKYTVVIPGNAHKHVVLSDTVDVYMVRGKYRVIQFFSLLLFLFRLSKQHQYTVISSQDPYFFGLIGYVFSRVRGLGLEVQIHGWGRQTYIHRYISSFVVSRAKSLRVVSHRLKRDLLHLGVSSKCIHIVSIYTDLSMFFSLPRTLSSLFTFLTVSRLVPIKRVSLQLKAFADVVSRHSHARLSIVGDGSDRSTLEALAVSLGITDKVTFHGAISHDELPSYYKKADCFLCTSCSEGWGLVVIEAAASSLPIIMSDVGCAGEVIIDKKSGLILSTSRVEDLISLMEEMITKEKMRSSLGMSAHKVVSMLPTKEQTLDAYYASWKQASKKPIV
ncbi:MAG: glycosyltransferase [Candidatus Magasanikbacteria bacterium]|jgi:glycosyltransferase involved in cell wall biosynthesis|nr:glycosyltransferase [Candidatus Magasanikbacteria bacterium]MBT4220753.1 glycosyltransferase [Candidatus Magasanikbacteria bacterium]MBT4350098.1 glycosyltransferase [Candidatus Magasanikbacteria bacterium]MBT4541459.1 glycosyltransferase [Candidatus Magasanikbacteria bacterium]MBT6252987.1 glycosyltransferase [Candidatus Magasanikbacteria bacterium]